MNKVVAMQLVDSDNVTIKVDSNSILFVCFDRACSVNTVAIQSLIDQDVKMLLHYQGVDGDIKPLRPDMLGCSDEEHEMQPVTTRYAWQCKNCGFQIGVGLIQKLSSEVSK